MNEEQIRIAREFARQEAGVKPKLSSKTKNAFNIPACFLPVLYNAIYKRLHLSIAFLVLTGIPHVVNLFLPAGLYLFVVFIVSLLTVLLALYSGMTGNEDAYAARDYDDESDFLISQRGWKVLGIIALIVHIVILKPQIIGHLNTAKMIEFANAKNEIKTAISEGAIDREVIGLTIIGESIPDYLAKYLKGSYDAATKTIRTKNGYKYTIEDYNQECSKREQNLYHEKLTACGKIYVDINGDKKPNKSALPDEVSDVKAAAKNTILLGDIFTLYLYSNDCAPKEGSIEEHILKKYERK